MVSDTHFLLSAIQILTRRVHSDSAALHPHVRLSPNK